MESVIEWTKPMVKKFKKAYAENKAADVFEFDGHKFVRKYAKYLIEYLDGRLQ